MILKWENSYSIWEQDEQGEERYRKTSKSSGTSDKEKGRQSEACPAVAISPVVGTIVHLANGRTSSLSILNGSVKVRKAIRRKERGSDSSSELQALVRHSFSCEVMEDEPEKVADVPVKMSPLSSLRRVRAVRELAMAGSSPPRAKRWHIRGVLVGSDIRRV